MNNKKMELIHQI